MGPRLLILLVAAAALAIFLATRTSAPPPVQDREVIEESDGEESIEEIRDKQRMLGDRPLPGEEVQATPTIQIEVDPTGRKNRLYLYITEPHGYYVETFYINFWYKPTPDTTFDEGPLNWTEIIDKYVAANQPLKSCVEVVPAELRNVGGAMGATANWGAEIVKYGRARARNPDKLPALADAVSCD